MQFNDHGWLNGMSEEELIAFQTERNRHDKARKEDPFNHTIIINWSTLNGFDEFLCSCGFGYKCDSGD